METRSYITELGQHLTQKTNEGRLNLGEKQTINYDTLFEEIYYFTMSTDRKDGAPPGDRATALKIACEKLMQLIHNEHI